MLKKWIRTAGYMDSDRKATVVQAKCYDQTCRCVSRIFAMELEKGKYQNYTVSKVRAKLLGASKNRLLHLF